MEKEENQNLKLGRILKNLLKEKSISMRSLSKKTGIDTSTISRIVNGKQEANLNHIYKFSTYLNIPMALLLEAQGYNINAIIQSKDSSNIVYKSIQAFLKSLEFENEEYFIDCIKKQLKQYEEYALTEEGTKIILDRFKNKLSKINSIGFYIKKLEEMYNDFSNKNISCKKRAVIGSCLLYFILPTDIIPDYIFPLGYLDDVIAMNLVCNKLSEINSVNKNST